jgi:hypothetical protein
MTSALSGKSRIVVIALILMLFSFIKLPSALASSSACDVSIDKSRIDVSDWSTESFTITTSASGFWLGGFPITCTTSINGSWFDTGTFNSNYDFTRKSSDMIENLFFFGGSIKEGSNVIESCWPSISDICSRTYITGYKKIQVPGYVPPKINNPQITPNLGSTKTICVKSASWTNKDCQVTSEMKWTYDSCWDTGASTVKIQIWNKAKKKFIQVKDVKVKKSDSCIADDPKFPKGVKFTITEKDTKNKTYRIMFPSSKSYSFHEEKIKVTFE